MVGVPSPCFPICDAMARVQQYLPKVLYQLPTGDQPMNFKDEMRDDDGCPHFQLYFSATLLVR